MFKNILVPVDFTEKNHVAIEMTEQLAGHEDGRVTLLHAIETMGEDPDDELKKFYDTLEKRAKRNMQKLVQHMESKGVHPRQEIVYGHRALEIVQFAAESEMDLIVLSSHRVDPNNPGRGWASISHKVAILSECPVLLVK